jgi:hypothetical protein
VKEHRGDQEIANRRKQHWEGSAIQGSGIGGTGQGVVRTRYQGSGLVIPDP